MLPYIGPAKAEAEREAEARATAASVDGQSPCAASEHASEARSTLLDQAPAFCGRQGARVLGHARQHPLQMAAGAARSNLGSNSESRALQRAAR